MACCGKRRGRVVKGVGGVVANNTKTTQFVISEAKNWLPFPVTMAPPGGWDAFGFRVKGPEELAQRVAQQKLADGKFTSLKAVYTEIVDEYCSRPGSPCGKNYSG